jgi:hypothetical protein
MPARGRSSPGISPMAMIILILCALGMAVHFIGEGLATTRNSSVIPIPAQVEQSESFHAHGEDHFLFPLLVYPTPDARNVRLFPLLMAGVLAISLTPQLPPPNL